jgi:glutamine---fructose-6-phosphate transaminase (isomerizing)
VTLNQSDDPRRVMSGNLMQAEMAEQPERLAALIGRADEIAAAVAPLRPAAGTSIVARGSSDHASVYGRYLIELASGRPAGLAAPSLHTLYDAHVSFEGYLAIAVSQSGKTPEIVTALERMQAEGAAGLAITNDGASPLARAARATLALDAGDEKAVPATKTVTATLAAFALVADAFGDAPFSREELERVPEWVAQVLDDAEAPRKVAETLAGHKRLLTVGRGLLYGAALEAALKLKETTMLSAEGFSGADLRHGPIAIVEHGYPVLAFLAGGPVHADMADLVEDLRGRGADVHVVGPDAGSDLPLPADVPEALVPIVAVVRAQQLALALARALGLDPDAPAGLSKVTAT